MNKLAACALGLVVGVAFGAMAGVFAVSARLDRLETVVAALKTQSEKDFAAIDQGLKTVIADTARVEAAAARLRTESERQLASVDSAFKALTAALTEAAGMPTDTSLEQDVEALAAEVADKSHREQTVKRADEYRQRILILANRVPVIDLRGLMKRLATMRWNVDAIGTLARAEKALGADEIDQHTAPGAASSLSELAAQLDQLQEAFPDSISSEVREEIQGKVTALRSRSAENALARAEQALAKHDASQAMELLAQIPPEYASTLPRFASAKRQADLMQVIVGAKDASDRLRTEIDQVRALDLESQAVLLASAFQEAAQAELVLVKSQAPADALAEIRKAKVEVKSALDVANHALQDRQASQLSEYQKYAIGKIAEFDKKYQEIDAKGHTWTEPLQMELLTQLKSDLLPIRDDCLERPVQQLYIRAIQKAENAFSSDSMKLEYAKASADTRKLLPREVSP